MSYARSAHPTSALSQLELVIFIKRDRTVYSLPVSGVVHIGRSSGNEIRIEHRSVSRRHVRLYVGETIEVEDLGSANGTWLFPGSAPAGNAQEETLHSRHDRQLEPGVRVPITLGDMIRLGAVLVSVQKRQTPSRQPVSSQFPSKKGEPSVLVDPAMKNIYDLAARAALSNISVLILGETGVGKDVLAAAVHGRSPRSAGPFVRLNCAALSETLLESELFGYQRGAFTGAHEAKEGLLESAHTGTVFLDEIGELPMSTQVKLLNVLETGEVLRVGSTKPRRIDVRFIAATNRDLTEQIQKGRFRKDLYFRINAVNFTIPPLRERKAEIEPLAHYFLSRFCKTAGIMEPTISREAVECMLQYSWPGNCREPKNAMERAPILCGDGPILAVHLPAERTLSRPTILLDDDEADVSDLWTATTSVGTLNGSHLVGTATERTRVLQALEQCGGNQTRAAKMLGISRRTLVNRLNEYGLPRPRK